MRTSRILITVFAAAFIFHIAFYFPQLPDSIESHFDGAGRPDGWMSKRSFLVLEIILLGSLLFEFLAIPWMIERLPDRWINLPNRDQWLSGERRAATFLTIRKFFEWFAVASFAVFTLSNHLVFAANLRREPLRSDLLITSLVVYFIFVAVWLIMFIAGFYRVEK